MTTIMTQYKIITCNGKPPLCNHPKCSHCRYHVQSQFADRQLQLFTNIPLQSLRSFTINLTTVPGNIMVEPFLETLRKAKDRLNKILNRHSSHVTFHGAVEVSWLPSGQWNIHLHATLYDPTLDYSSLRNYLKKYYTASRSITIKPFEEETATNTKNNIIRRWAGYCIKFNHTHMLPKYHELMDSILDKKKHSYGLEFVYNRKMKS